jgi:hypothetical protein
MPHNDVHGGPVRIYGVNVRSADTAGFNFDEHLTRSGPWNRDFFDDQGLPFGFINHCSHRSGVIGLHYLTSI